MIIQLLRISLIHFILKMLPDDIDSHDIEPAWEILKAYRGPKLSGFESGRVYVLYFVRYQLTTYKFLTDALSQVQTSHPEIRICGFTPLPKRAILEQRLPHEFKKESHLQDTVLPDFYLDYMSKFRKWCAKKLCKEDFEHPTVIIMNKSGHFVWHVEISRGVKIFETDFEKRLTDALAS